MEAGFHDQKGWDQYETHVNRTQKITVNTDKSAARHMEARLTLAYMSQMLISIVRKNSLKVNHSVGHDLQSKRLCNKQAEPADGSRARHHSSSYPKDTDSWPWWRDNESARDSSREGRRPRALGPTRSTLSLSQGVTLLILLCGIRISQTKLMRTPSGEEPREEPSSPSPASLAKCESMGRMTRGRPPVIESLLCEKGADCLTAALPRATLCPGVASPLNPGTTDPEFSFQSVRESSKSNASKCEK